jgi:hypothetical protein
MRKNHIYKTEIGPVGVPPILNSKDMGPQWSVTRGHRVLGTLTQLFHFKRRSNHEYIDEDREEE